MSERTRKLVSIRHRTDHDLLVLVKREIDRGVTLVDLANTRHSPYFTQAAKAYESAAIWLSKIVGLSQDDQLRVEANLKVLRSKLDRVPALAQVERYPSSVAS